MCGFIAQSLEHRTGIAEVTGSNPVEALIFFRFLLSSWFKDVRAQKFPRTDFFKTLTVGRKW